MTPAADPDTKDAGAIGAAAGGSDRLPTAGWVSAEGGFLPRFHTIRVAPTRRRPTAS